jgi:hypothetical protein
MVTSFVVDVSSKTKQVNPLLLERQKTMEANATHL